MTATRKSLAERTPADIDYQALHDRLEAELEEIRRVVDISIASLRYASTDVAMAYAELQAERGDVVPLAELLARRTVAPLPADHPLARRKPWPRDRWGLVL